MPVNLVYPIWARRLVLVLASSLAMLAGSQAMADALPLWEVGGGFGVLSFPDYRGSDQRSSYILPIPYVIYRGDRFKIDRTGARGQMFKNDNSELDISLNGSVPVNSNRIDARKGMPDLDPTLEIGPEYRLHLLRDDTYLLDFRLPVRASITSRLDYVGLLTQPQLNLDIFNPLGLQGWKLGLVAGPLFADGRYNEYFYSVAPKFARAGRPAYDAGGGYAGSQFISAVSKRYPKFWVGAFLKYDNLSGASFENSPLVRDKSFFTGGFAVAWVFWQSPAMVETPQAGE